MEVGEVCQHPCCGSALKNEKLLDSARFGLEGVVAQLQTNLKTLGQVKTKELTQQQRISLVPVGAYVAWKLRRVLSLEKHILNSAGRSYLGSSAPPAQRLVNRFERGVVLVESGVIEAPRSEVVAWVRVPAPSCPSGLCDSKAHQRHSHDKPWPVFWMVSTCPTLRWVSRRPLRPNV